VPGGRLALKSEVLANLRASPKYLLTNCRRCYTEGKYGVSFRSSLTVSTETISTGRGPLERLAELTPTPLLLWCPNFREFPF
jgi:hypothetical protein